MFFEGGAPLPLFRGGVKLSGVGLGAFCERRGFGRLPPAVGGLAGPTLLGCAAAARIGADAGQPGRPPGVALSKRRARAVLCTPQNAPSHPSPRPPLKTPSRPPPCSEQYIRSIGRLMEGRDTLQLDRQVELGEADFVDPTLAFRDEGEAPAWVLAVVAVWGLSFEGLGFLQGRGRAAVEGQPRRGRLPRR